MSNVPLSDAWAYPDAFNASFNHHMDKREALIREFLSGGMEGAALRIIRQGIKEEVEMLGIQPSRRKMT